MSKDIVQRAVSLLEREGFIKEAEAIEALEAEVINHRSIMDHAVKRAEAAEAEVERLKHIAEHRHPTMDDLLNERLKTKAAEAQASRMRDALNLCVAFMQSGQISETMGLVLAKARKALEEQ